MDLATLAIFRTVAKELSITRAAQQLGRVPSNVTTRIQQLEEELGVLLFERDRKRFSLTAQGELFLDYANQILNLSEEARQVLKPGTPTGVLCIGSMECTVASRLPLPLARFHQQWPDIRLELSTSPSRQLIDAVERRHLDCALVALPPGDSEMVSEELMTWPVFREELILLLPPGHAPVHGPADLVPRSLAAFPHGCTYRGIAEEWLSADAGMAAGFRVQDVGSYHAMLACVSSGSCISVMPRSVLDLMRHAAPVEEMPVRTVDTTLVWRRGFDTPAFTAFRETLAGFTDIVGERP